MVHSRLAFSGHFILGEVSGGVGMQGVISALGIVIMAATAYLLSWYKAVEGRSPSSRTKMRDADLAGGEA